MRFDAIVVPRGAEARAVARGWNDSPPPFVLVPAGASAGRALALDPHAQTVLVLGLCGALDRTLRVGEAVVYAAVVDGSQTVDLDGALATECGRILASAPILAANVPVVVGNAAAKAALHASTGAAAIDMEAAAIVRTLHARGVRVAMVRVVSDDAVSDLPDLTGVFDERGALRPLRLALAFIRTPRRSVAFIRHALTALAALQTTSQRLAV